MSGVKDEFPQALRSLRERIGVTQEEFAKAIGITRQTLSNYEKGERLPDIEIVGRISDVTGCSLKYLFGTSYNINERYDEIGSITELTDDAIDAIHKDMLAPILINPMVTHGNFHYLTHALMAALACKQHDVQTNGSELKYAGAKATMHVLFDEIIDAICDDKDLIIDKEFYETQREYFDCLDSTMSALDILEEEFPRSARGRALTEEQQRLVDEYKKRHYSETNNPIEQFRKRMKSDNNAEG